MNPKRVLIATIVGALCGVFCAYGTSQIKDPSFPVTAGVLASVFYNRLLIGFFVGLADNIKLHSVIRGALIGAIISLAMSIIPIIDGQAMGGITLLIAGIIYGILADVIATRFSK
jgi:H+/Cl- antiporter ClcA